MSRPDLDRATLDALLDGGGEAEDWASLVASPQAAEQWAEARARRDSIDALASAVAGHPWLAERLLAVRRASRRRGASAEAPPCVQVSTPEVSLTIDVESSEPRPIEIRWGRSEALSLRPGEEVHLDPGSVRTAFYETSSSSGRLPSAWRMEAGESPVLLVLVGAAVPDLASALAAGPLAALVLVEAPRGKMGP